MSKKKIVISLGGSLIYTKDLEKDFLSHFRKLIENFIPKYKFFIVVGGGNLARNYQKTAQNLIPRISYSDLDWLGIKATQLNAQLILSLFKKKAYPYLISEYKHLPSFTKKPIIIISGWQPGRSTDYVSVKVALKYKVNKIVNLTNVDYVYDKDPKKYSYAKPLKFLKWSEYFKIIKSRWKPGLSLPFDPKASLLTQKNKIKVIILNGSRLSNFKRLLEDKNFKGTVIS